MSSFCFDDAPGIVLLITTLMIGQVLFEAPLISTKIVGIHAPSGISIPVHTWELGMVYNIGVFEGQKGRIISHQIEVKWITDWIIWHFFIKND